DCYVALRDIEAQRNVAGARESLDRIAAEFNGAMPVLESLTRARREAVAGKSTIEGELAATRASLSDRAAALSDAMQQLSQSRLELADFTAQSQQHQTNLRLRLGEADTRALAAEQRFTQSQAELADLRSALESRDRQLAETLAKSEARLQELANALAA